MAESEYNDSLGHAMVVGGCGFLGHHIVKLLLSRHPKTKISILDLRISSNQIPNPQTSYHACNITDADAVQQLFKKLKPDVVIHTASPVALGTPQEVMYKVNVEGTRNLLKAAQDNGVKGFVYTSSASVIMGEMTELVNVDERWPTIAGEKQPEYYTHTKVSLIMQQIYHLLHRANSYRFSQKPRSSKRIERCPPFSPAQ